MGNLNKKQQELLQYVKKYIETYSIAPTLNEIAEKFQISIPAAQLRLRTLLLKGYISKEPNKPRSIIVKENIQLNSVTLPVLGLISAGEGISVFEESEPELLEVPTTMVHTSYPHYCLKVDGNSMIEDGIMDSDYIVVRQQNYADNGDIIVAIISEGVDEKANLKRYYKHNNKIELQPRNKELKSKFYDLDKIQIRGKFCGLIRI